MLRNYYQIAYLPIRASIPLFLPQIFTMALNSIMKIFMPKDRIFYSLFEEVADGVAKMGKM